MAPYLAVQGQPCDNREPYVEKAHETPAGFPEYVALTAQLAYGFIRIVCPLIDHGILSFG